MMSAAISLTAINWNTLAQASAAQLVDCLVEGSLIAIFAGLALGIARRQPSGTRFAVWFSSLIAIALLPIFGVSSWSQVSSTSASPAITVPASWAVYAVGAWAAMAAWFLVGVGRGLCHLRVLRRNCLPVDAAGLDPRLQQTLTRGLSVRPITLCTSALVKVPTAIGFMKPVIVVPGWVMEELSVDELNQILLHEIAHLRRWDDWTNLAQKLVKALFFFHPAVWWIERKVSLEREMACDDAVVAETDSPRAYAECLTHLAERTMIQRSLALAQAALGRIRQTSLRVAQILDVNRPAASRRTWKTAVSFVAGFAIVCGLGISRAPRLIAFRDNPSLGAAAPVMASVSPTIQGARVSRAAFRDEPLQIVPASLKVHPVHPGANRGNRDLALSPAAKRATRMFSQANVHLASGTTAPTAQLASAVTPVAFTQTFLVVIENTQNGAPDQPTYQFQFWRMTVFHPAVDSATRIPRKEI